MGKNKKQQLKVSIDGIGDRQLKFTNQTSTKDYPQTKKQTRSQAPSTTDWGNYFWTFNE